MRLEEWVSEQNGSRANTVAELSADSGVSVHTLQSVMRGARLNKYNLAKAIEDATGGRVTIKELCE